MLMKNIFLNLKILKKMKHDLLDTLLHYEQKKTELMSSHGVPLSIIRFCSRDHLPPCPSLIPHKRLKWKKMTSHMELIPRINSDETA